jgi:hypothetical protein
MNTTKDLPPTILMSREGSSMASTWTEHLCVSCLDGKWLIGEYGYNWAASIDDIPEEERYTEDGELKIPDEWDGHKVLGIADGEYIETDELVERGNDIEFTENELKKAIDFAVNYGWNDYPNFDKAMKQLEKMVVDSSQ